MKASEQDYYVIEFKRYSANVICFATYENALVYFNAHARDKNWEIIKGDIIKRFEDESE